MFVSLFSLLRPNLGFENEQVCESYAVSDSKFIRVQAANSATNFKSAT
jgi:hypothetical protein